MANNRMWLICKQCPGDRFNLVKYYPTTGWYINRPIWGLFWFGPDLNRWLDKHVHRSLFGNEIVVMSMSEQDE